MTREVTALSSRRNIVVCAAITCFVARVFGAGYECPDEGPPYPKPAHVLETTVDKKGGKLELTCTNASASGDFVWTYTPPGGVKQVIGRCVYVGGKNQSESIDDPTTGNLRFWIHSCVNPTPINPAGDKEMVIDIFDKNNNKSTQRKMIYRVAQSKWVEAAARFDTSNATYLAFNPIDANGDTIPDESFNHITSNLYGPTPPANLPAGSEAAITLESSFVAGGNRVEWDVGTLTPTYVAGDYIDLANVLLSNIISADPRVTASSTSSGVRLLVNSTITPATGELLAVLAPSLPGYTANYSIVDGSPTSFYANAFDSAQPLEDFNFSSQLDLTDMPGYGAGMGHLQVVPEPSLALAGFLLFPRRRRA